MMKRSVIALLLSLLINMIHGSVVESRSPLIARGGALESPGGGDDEADLHPERFVSVAPLIVAAVCSDGIVMIATHTSYLQEPLLLRIDITNDNNITFDDSTNETTNTTTNTTETTINATRQDTSNTTTTVTASNTTLPQDLPLHFRGPFRIQPIDSVGSTLMCAGWRTDGDWLTQKCRDLAQTELAKYGPITTGLGYGRYIAQEASLWMAQCAVSDQLRALSCVALLAVSGDDRSPGGYLWLVDSTGAYRVRAHALGLGSASLNERLWGINFTNTTKEEAAQVLLEIMVTPTLGNDNATNAEQHVVAEPILDSRALIEAAVLDSSHQRMTRIRQPFLGSKHLPAFVVAKVNSN